MTTTRQATPVDLDHGPRKWAIFPDLLIRVRPEESRMNSHFLAAALRSERAHLGLRSKAKGLAGSMPKIDQRTLGETAIPLPPKSRQDEVWSGSRVGVRIKKLSKSAPMRGEPALGALLRLGGTSSCAGGTASRTPLHDAHPGGSPMPRRGFPRPLLPPTHDRRESSH